MAKPGSAVPMELEDRDPNALNSHLQILWDEVIGEPEGARSPECAWRLSSHCFRASRVCCYTLLAVLLAPPAALCLGCSFACLAFEQIWCVVPCLRMLKIRCASTRTCMQAWTHAIILPITETLGYLCRNIRIKHQNIPESPDKYHDVLLI